MIRPSPSAAIRPEDLLAEFTASTTFDAMSDRVRHEARRSLVNIVGTKLAGCCEPAVEIARKTLAPLSPGGGCTLIGRGERADAALASFVNALSANIFDFDDTHEATIIHPAAVVFGAAASVGVLLGLDALRKTVRLWRQKNMPNARSCASPHTLLISRTVPGIPPRQPISVRCRLSRAIP